MTGPITATLGEQLYNAFWARAGWADPTPFTKQAPAIISMWTNIAADALAARTPDAATVERLTAALEPFVGHGRAACGFDRAMGPVRFYTDQGYREVPCEDFIRARAALSSATSARGE